MQLHCEEVFCAFSQKVRSELLFSKPQPSLEADFSQLSIKFSYQCRFLLDPALYLHGRSNSDNIIHCANSQGW